MIVLHVWSQFVGMFDIENFSFARVTILYPAFVRQRRQGEWSSWNVTHYSYYKSSQMMANIAALKYFKLAWVQKKKANIA